MVGRRGGAVSHAQHPGRLTTDNLYTEIISLPPGRHRLYHGVIAASNQPANIILQYFI